jgi:predicted nucleotidyltransferase
LLELKTLCYHGIIKANDKDWRVVQMARNTENRTDNTLLYRALRGSRLYGLEHANSDWDYFEVYADQLNAGNRRPQQKLEGEDDTLRMSLSSFMDMLDGGHPMALEALWAPESALLSSSPLMESLRASYRPALGTAYDRHRRSAKSMAAEDMNPTPKTKRHAARLEFQAEMLLQHGYFNPQWFSQTDAANMEHYE